MFGRKQRDNSRQNLAIRSVREIWLFLHKKLNPMRLKRNIRLDVKDCGSACLKIIAKYYGKYYSLQYLRDLCSIIHENVSFMDISHAAEKIGLRSISRQPSTVWPTESFSRA